LYGRNQAFRATLDAAHTGYAAQVPANTLVYEAEPRVGVPRRRHRRGQPPKRLKVLSQKAPREARVLARSRHTDWQRVRVRPTERGWLEAEFAVQRIWTVAAGQPARAEWLVMQREADGDIAYTLLNAPPDTPAQTLIEWSCQRYFTERAFQDAMGRDGGGAEPDRYRSQRPLVRTELPWIIRIAAHWAAILILGGFQAVRFNRKERVVSSPGRTLWLRSGEVEPVKVHDLVPRRDKVVEELRLGVVTAVDFGDGPQLRV
jgi:hypothetical protein